MSQATPGTLDDVAISWDIGSAYELFVSLEVLHHPDIFGIRASWAAGVRSRLSAAERGLLEDVLPFLYIPFHWISQLPQPKDSITALLSLRQIPPAERVPALFSIDNMKEPVGETLRAIAARKSWEKVDLETLAPLLCKDKKDLDQAALKRYLDWWAKPEEFGELLTSALQSYHQAFFEEEEKRIAPVLKQGLENARALAKNMSVTELLAELSQGVHFDQFEEMSELVLVPAYWTTPLIMYGDLSPSKMVFVFGVRPADMSVVPGEMVPEGLIRALKALADPTRLRILHDLSLEAVTPSELARRLRLRAPTVTHHLNELRLAGLVNLKLEGQEKRYTARSETIETTCSMLQAFLQRNSNV
jgi:DNA-binding transcriptional ArsR family regulator